ncbi:SigB/SigF/SigG family RNA polymerase sigma factor [Actinomarinicola tropica]|uniref:SigB/SigF/SigG family RNA polymerase sigma factor n=1 Tax=Actinomarinicola tropica TaxID=2789776 RepID=UPI001898827E|nr:SigB/SigF/SigG family RNA polymerase sigma factor [Actinomarinicola tropica]
MAADGGPAAPDERFVRYRATGDPHLREEIVRDHWWVVTYVVRRYQGKGEPNDDLEQVAALGLVAAVERFDPTAGSTFPAFAIPTALGEVRRHFRDATWRVRVPRRVKDLSVQVTSATEELTSDLGRTPTADELGDRLGVAPSAVREAWEASAAARPLSADGPTDDEGPSVLDVRTVRQSVDELAAADDKLLVRQLLERLPPRSRRVLVLRYFEGLSQAEVAERVGISQPHVSRLLRTALAELRTSLTDPRAAGRS